MAESFKRMYGPNRISTDASALTTLFTVPTGKTYVVRDIMQVQTALTGPTNASTTGVYYVDSSPVCTVGGPLTAGQSTTQKFSGSIVVHEGQSFKGYIAGSAQTVPKTFSYANAGPLYQMMTGTDTAVTSGHSMNASAPNLFWVVGFAADTPSTQTITTTKGEYGSLPVASWGEYTHVTSVGTGAGAGNDYIFASLGTLAVVADGATNAGIGVRFIGTSALSQCGAVFVPVTGAPFASRAITGLTHVQTATASGTTSQPSITFTPTYSNSLVIFAAGATSGTAGDTFNTPANYTKLSGAETALFEGVVSTGGQAVVYTIQGSNATNPACTLSVTPEEWVAVVVEIPPPLVSTTVTGIVID